MAANSTVHRTRTHCRACGRATLAKFLSLGRSALANSFPKSAAEFAREPRFPLEVYLCTSCSLVQLADVIAPEVLFSNYLYVSGTSELMTQHFRGYAEAVVARERLGADALVVEAASNDGTLLKQFQACGVRVLGVEPAENIAAAAQAAGVETLNEFFGPESAQALREQRGQARAFCANNVLAHVDEPVAFLRGAATLVEPDGLVVVEVPYLREFVERLEYDTVYHEHLCYFSVSALMRLCEEAGLCIEAVEQVAVHGGSLRLLARPKSALVAHAPSVRENAAREAADGLTTLPRFERFALEVERQKSELVALLCKLQADGRSVGGYGAPAKGNTMLQYCGIGVELLPWTVDKNPLKVGRFTPGMHIPVLPAGELLARQPDFCLILAWNFADEIQRQQAEYRRRGGRFILPIPAPRIV